MRHGRIPIQDQFTDRTDLTKFQKWQLRNGRKMMAAGAGKAKTEAIDLGLTLLSMAAKPGVPLTQEDIASWCAAAAGKCSITTIQQIERKALRKMRCRLGAEYAAVLELFNERHPAARISDLSFR